MNWMAGHDARVGGCRWFMKYRNILGRDRHLTFELVYAIAAERDLKDIVETGCIRDKNMSWGGDGCSSIILSDLAFLLDGTLISVDIDREACRVAELVTEKWHIYRSVICSDSLLFFGKRNKEIDVLYLDSGDDPYLQLKEIESALPKVNRNGIILLDDVPTKGTMAIDYAVEQGWIVHTLVYQALLLHIDSLNKSYDGNEWAKSVSTIPSFSVYNEKEWDRIRQSIEEQR